MCKITQGSKIETAIYIYIYVYLLYNGHTYLILLYNFLLYRENSGPNEPDLSGRTRTSDLAHGSNQTGAMNLQVVSPPEYLNRKVSKANVLDSKQDLASRFPGNMIHCQPRLKK